MKSIQAILCVFFVLWWRQVASISVDDEVCNLCGCALNECSSGAPATFNVAFRYEGQGQVLRQSCHRLNQQINQDASPYPNITWCENDLVPIYVESCACFFRATGEEVPLPGEPTVAPDASSSSGSQPNPSNPSNPSNPAIAPSNLPPCIANSPGCDSSGRPIGAGSTSKSDDSSLPGIVGFLVVVTASWALLVNV